MTLKQLISKHHWVSVSLILKELYPEQQADLDGYEKVFNQLSCMNSETSELCIQVTNVVDDFDGEEYVSVSGIYENPQSEEEEISYAIEFVSWKEWLGMKISKDSLNTFSELEIIAHALFEMTFFGFDEEDIQKEMKSITDVVEEFKNLTDEEKKAQTYSIDELFNSLKNNNESSN